MRTHGERLQAFTGIEDVEAALTALMERDEPLVKRLPREPGKRETRYHHCLGIELIEVEPEPSLHARSPDDLGRLERLELEVEDLRRELERLRILIEGPASEAVSRPTGID